MMGGSAWAPKAKPEHEKEAGVRTAAAAEEEEEEAQTVQQRMLTRSSIDYEK
jgi:hypothetical protein